MPIYNKLVRDGIPGILEEKGKKFNSRPVKNRQEYFDMLMLKLQEEVQEFLMEPSAEEVADIQEVLDALSYAIGSNVAEVKNIKVRKAASRGRFYDGLVLESVED